MPRPAPWRATSLTPHSRPRHFHRCPSKTSTVADRRPPPKPDPGPFAFLAERRPPIRHDRASPNTIRDHIELRRQDNMRRRTTGGARGPHHRCPAQPQLANSSTVSGVDRFRLHPPAAKWKRGAANTAKEDESLSPCARTYGRDARLSGVTPTTYELPRDAPVCPTTSRSRAGAERRPLTLPPTDPSDRRVQRAVGRACNPLRGRAAVGCRRQTLTAVST